MADPVIRVRGLSKAYRLGVISRQTLVDEFRYWRHRARGRDPRRHMGRVDARGRAPMEPEGLFWALRDVSFEVDAGEVVGIVGSNGAGKSTLLKILSRITEPTSGEAVLRGRVRSLLEVGTGFHPDLTGRENIYLNGAIMGMTRREIAGRFDRIVAFSEIERFIDTPVKRYSSGMYVRLAFAVAAHLEPEIFVIDEVLAVGDVSFQEKCLGKIGEIVHAGRTVLFVSHNMGAIRKLCSRALWLDGGTVRQAGDTQEVIEAYLARLASREGEYRPDPAEAAAAGPVALRRVTLLDARGGRCASFGSDARAAIEIEYDVRESTAQTRVGLRVVSEDSTVVWTSVDTDPDGRGTVRRPGRYVARCELPVGLLAGGRYHVGVFADRRLGRELLFESLNALSFAVHVVSGVGSVSGEARLGLVRVACPWTTEAA
jgi:lipopolysaccharide transport system ATP-binding protein